MRGNRAELIKQMRDVLDEMIPVIPVDDRTLGLVSRIGERILKAAAEGQASYVILLVAASAEMGAISKENKPVFYSTEDGLREAVTSL